MRFFFFFFLRFQALSVRITCKINASNSAPSASSTIPKPVNRLPIFMHGLFPVVMSYYQLLLRSEGFIVQRFTQKPFSKQLSWDRTSKSTTSRMVVLHKIHNKYNAKSTSLLKLTVDTRTQFLQRTNRWRSAVAIFLIQACHMMSKYLF